MDKDVTQPTRYSLNSKLQFTTGLGTLKVSRDQTIYLVVRML
jgi:hypothetical protein